MATREEVFAKFGPLIIEVLADIMTEEINILRINQGMPERTKQYILDRIANHQSEITPYDWMSHQD